MWGKRFLQRDNGPFCLAFLRKGQWVLCPGPPKPAWDRQGSGQGWLGGCAASRRLTAGSDRHPRQQPRGPSPELTALGHLLQRGVFAEGEMEVTRLCGVWLGPSPEGWGWGWPFRTA